MIQMGIRIIIDLFIVTGLFFAFAGVVGILRMPDAFCRMQSSTNISTLGVLGVLAGAIIYAVFVPNTPDWAMVVKLAVLAVFYIVTSPIAGHALARAAYHHEKNEDVLLSCDKYGEDLEDAD